MAEPEWTPGPWQLFNKNRTVAVTAGEGPHNEVVFWTGFDESHFRRQAVANARLIAAAPELYDALDLLSKASWDLDALAGGKEQMEANAQARAALTKARGDG